MQIYRFIFLILLCSPALGLAQTRPDSCRVRISLLTCGPGQELYSMWGHTGIRVIDSAASADIVFNYGTFDDSDPYFYVKFTRGIMIYALSVQYFTDFMQEYQWEGRNVIEQELNLNCDEKNRLLRALKWNALEENRFYNYYFHTDNCTTRAGEIVLQHLQDKAQLPDIINGKYPSYRDLIHEYLDKGGLAWTKLGIDILLGRSLDKKINSREAMFLPDYLMKVFDKTSMQGRALVAEKKEILAGRQGKPANNWFSPMVFFSLLLLLMVLLSVYSSRLGSRLLAIFDTIFFLVLGMLGLLILVLWIIRVDTVCRNNLNILWALPTHLPMAFLMHRKKEWIKKYFRYVFIISLILAVCWFFIPQQINVAIAPVLLIIIVRSFFRSR